jgi:septum formation inhibitor-activating ATPase MinD
MRAGIRNNDIEAALHIHLFAMIPDDSDSALRSLNRGIPLYIRYPRSPASRAYKLLAVNLMSYNHPVSAEEANRQAAAKQQREALLASSKFG